MNLCPVLSRYDIKRFKERAQRTSETNNNFFLKQNKNTKKIKIKTFTLTHSVALHFYLKSV